MPPPYLSPLLAASTLEASRGTVLTFIVICLYQSILGQGDLFL